jgi:hypothetical protein
MAEILQTDGRTDGKTEGRTDAHQVFEPHYTVVHINSLQINCSQNFLLKMCKKNCTSIHW